MTQPGSILYPQPSWWVRSNRVGVNTNLGFSWSSNPVGQMTPKGHSTGGYGWSGVAHGIKLPPTYLAVGSGAESSTSPVTFSNTAPTNANYSLIIAEYSTTAASPTISASFGSTSATLVTGGTVTVTTATPFYCISVFKVPWPSGPPTGSQTVTFTCSGAGLAASIDVTHYRSVGSVGTPTTLGNQSGQPSMSVSSTSASTLYVQALGYRAAATGNTFSAYTGGNQRELIAATVGTNPPLLIGDAVGNGSTLTLSATRSSTTNAWGGIIVPLSS